MKKQNGRVLFFAHRASVAELLSTPSCYFSFSSLIGKTDSKMATHAICEWDFWLSPSGDQIVLEYFAAAVPGLLSVCFRVIAIQRAIPV